MVQSVLTRFSKYGVAFAFVISTCLLLLSCSQTPVTPPSVNGQSNFVIRSQSRLLLHGQTFRFSGANIYWLGLDENVGGVAYPSHFRVDDALTAVAEMGATVVRSHTLGISVGCPLCVEPSLGVFNQVALQHIDYAIQSASVHHIRLIIPLIDNWHYYHGGKQTFTKWRDLNNENLFYSNKTVIHDFEEYITALLNHVNTYTGVAYKDDPTILGWETGNELASPVSWIRTIAATIKHLDPHHLVIDGSSFVDTDALSLADVDMYDAHYYPASLSRLQGDAQQVLATHKVFYVGEYPWQSGDPLSDFLPALEKSGEMGDTYWDFFAHNDTYGYVQHNDGYTLHYPGDTPAMRNAVQLLRNHAYHMQSKPAPSPALPGAPLITSIQNKQLAWRGTALGDTYSIERSTKGANGPWTLICDHCATDNSTPWTDSTQPGGILWYRVQASNSSGQSGPYSPALANQQA